MPEIFDLIINAQYNSNVKDVDAMTASLGKQSVVVSELEKQQYNLGLQLNKGKVTRAEYVKQYAALEKQIKSLAVAEGELIKETKKATAAKKAQNKVQKASTEGTKKGTIAQKGFNAATLLGSKALKGLKTALIQTGIGALGIAVGVATQYFTRFVEKIVDAIKAKGELDAITKQGIENAKDEITTLDRLYKTTQNTNASIGERKKAVAELQKQYPAYFGNIKQENILNGKAEDQYLDLRDAILETAKAKAIVSELATRAGSRLEEEVKNTTRLEKAQLAYNSATKLVGKGIAQTRVPAFGTSPEIVKQLERNLRDAENAIKGFNARVLKEDSDLINLLSKTQKRVKTPTEDAANRIDKSSNKIVKFYKKIGDAAAELNKRMNKELGNEFIQSLIALERDEALLEKLQGEPIKPLTPITGTDVGELGQVPENAVAQQEAGYDATKKSLEDIAKLKEKQKEDDKKSLKDSLASATETAQGFIDLEIQKLDRLEEEQNKRLEDAKKRAGEDANVSVKAEEQRLREIQAEREKFVRAQKALDALQIVSNQALAVSQALVMVTSAGAGGGPAAPLTIAAAVAAMIAGIAASALAVNSAFADTGFEEGGYTGDKGKSDVAGVVHGQEFVMTKTLTDNHRDLFEGIHNGQYEYLKTGFGKIAIPKSLDYNALASDHNQIKMYYNGIDRVQFSEMNTELKGIKSLLKQREVRISNNFDARGFGYSVATAMGEIKHKNELR